MNEQRDQLATQRITTAARVCGPLDDALHELLAAEEPVSHAIDRIIPFPRSVPSPPDALVQEFGLAISLDGRVSIDVRYGTESGFGSIVELHNQAFSTTGISLSDPLSPIAHLAITRGDATTVEGSRADGALSALSAACKVTIDDFEPCRYVCVSVEYDGLDPAPFLDDYANWHRGAAPVDDATVEGIEIQVRLNPSIPAPTPSTLYTTRYRLADTTIDRIRPVAEHRLRTDGWTWLEPEQHSLFLAGPFDAEIHFTQQGPDVLINFVGEFGLFD